MFSRRQNTPSAIVIDGLEVLHSETPIVEHMWAAAHVSNEQLSRLVGASITSPPDTIDLALQSVVTTAHQYTPLRQFDFTRKSRMSGNLRHAGAVYTLAVKGLPEQILACCDATENEREAIALHIQKLSAHGESVIAIAVATLTQPIDSLAQLSGTHMLTFVGLVSLTNTLAGDARHLVRTAQARNITLYLLSGAHQQTAFTLAHQAGIAMDRRDVRDARLLHIAPVTAQSATVFAHALPKQKAEIIQALRQTIDSVMVVSTKQELRSALDAKLPRRKV